jgi:small-conductance mechanosensitive channel
VAYNQASIRCLFHRPPVKEDFVTMTDKGTVQTRGRYRRELYGSVVALVLAIGAIVATIELAREAHVPLLVNQKERILAAEIAVFGVIIVEILGRVIITKFRERDAVQLGVAVRATLRVASYSVFAIAIVSILAANPSLAIGVGTVTGIIVGFSVQNIIGNVVAGAIISIVRLFRIGDEITVMGVTGNVVEMGVIYTRLDTDKSLVFVPNMAMLTNAVQCKKESPDP